MPLRERALCAGRVAGVLLLILALTGTAGAQGGRGGGKGRQRSPEPAPARESADDEYPLNGAQVLEAINRGEATQALAYYERAAAQAEQQGNALRAARAWHAVSLVTLRQGRFQKAIQSASRSIQQFKAAGSLAQSDVGAWASAYSQLGSAYRAVGDLARAHSALEEGLELARNNLRGRHESQAEGQLLNGLAMVAYASRTTRPRSPATRRPPSSSKPRRAASLRGRRTGSAPSCGAGPRARTSGSAALSSRWDIRTRRRPHSARGSRRPS